MCCEEWEEGDSTIKVNCLSNFYHVCQNIARQRCFRFQVSSKYTFMSFPPSLSLSVSHSHTHTSVVVGTFISCHLELNLSSQLLSSKKPLKSVWNETNCPDFVGEMHSGPHYCPHHDCTFAPGEKEKAARCSWFRGTCTCSSWTE